MTERGRARERRTFGWEMMVRVPGATAGPVVPAAKASELLKRARTAGMPGGKASNPQDADGVRLARATPSRRLWSCMVCSRVSLGAIHVDATSSSAD